MIELYRASAGSGKTYTLAKKYIWYYITITPEGEKPRLRTDAELTDSARHILAVTFTNKATNEMQMRIVNSLYKIHRAEYVWETDSDGNPYIKKPDYIWDFHRQLGVSPGEISEICGKALAILLEGYSDFNVSTIDSFFQQVLRTFAYESEINDNYQVELDSEYLSQVSVDATLEEVDSNAANRDTAFWIRKLMDRAEQGKWNIFSRPLDSKTGDNPYRDFVRSVGKMENEEYKLKRDAIEKYFAANHDITALYTHFETTIEAPIREAFEKMQDAFRKFDSLIPAELRGLSGNSILGKFASAAKKALSPNLKWDSDPSTDKFPKLDKELINKKQVQKWLADNPKNASGFRAAADKAAEELERWSVLLSGQEFLHWRLYAVNLPFFALFNIVNRKRQDYLDETGALELGETAMILRGIIGDDDTPFIYERLGTRLNHFLIDEFQDTSGLQWEIIKPLLSESNSTGNGNLIIGDAKQSIYRFRNANPSLITTTVPNNFPNDIETHGNIPSENTNYRSYRHVVQFNNSFFDYLVGELDRAVSGDPSRMTYGPLYGNVVQQPANEEPEGYIEIRMAGDAKKQWSNYMLPQIPKLISRLLERGYQQREIAILVQTHAEGDSVIASLSDYNANRADGSPEIRFVSEQSLKVASSRAVRIITGVLENMARGSKPEIRTGDDSKYRGVCTWNEVMANFKYFSIDRPEESMAERLDAYLNGGANFNALTDLLGSMQSLAIPALVEAAAAKFLSPDLRQKDAVYLAAFQDLVLEYCDSHPTDIGSFLKWWARKSRTAAISSPENTDAIQIVTVHKSKGLEYACVIVPFADWDLGDKIDPYRKEWRWEKPQVLSHPSIPMPDFIPIETSSAMKGTGHEPLLNKYFDMVKMDRLNAAYVAFTRAKKELYIFCTSSGADRIVESKGNYASKTGVGKYLYDFLTQAVDRTPTGEDDPLLEGNIIQNVGMQTDNLGQAYVFSIGTPVADVTKDRKSVPAMTPLKSYDSVAKPTFLKYRSEGLPTLARTAENADGNEDNAEEEDLDPRSEGNLKHAVLELVRVPEDLPEAVRHLCITGVIPDSLAPQIEESLAEKLNNPDVAQWFDGTARVINERPVLKMGHLSRRPDRLLIYPDKSAVVVDYKFGKIDKTKKYHNQIREYIYRLTETRQFKTVRGYLWYVNENKIEEVKKS